MLNKSVARRYAEAFFSIARSNNKIDEYEQDLEKVVQTLDATENLKDYMAHLLIPAANKKDVVDKIFAEQVSPMTMNFFKLVIDKRRQNYMEMIFGEYKEMADASRNITKADLITARAISEEEVNVFAQKLSATTGRTVKLNVILDASLLGGAKVKLGDQVIDGSVAKKLEKMKDMLKQTKIS